MRGAMRFDAVQGGGGGGTSAFTIYSGDATGATDQTAAINAAAAALNAAGGGVLWFPIGDYRIDGTLTLYPLVSYQAAGKDTTRIFRGGASAVAMFERLEAGSPQAWNPRALVGLTIDGALIADIGLNLKLGAYLGIHECSIIRCNDYSLYGIGVLFIVARGCYFGEDTSTRRTGTHVFLDKDAGTNVQSNFNRFVECRFESAIDHAFFSTHSAGNLLQSCDFEFNGVGGGASTVLSYLNSPSSEGPALTLRDCWFEANAGYAEIQCAAPGSHDTRVLIESCFLLGSGAITYGIEIDGGSGLRNKVLTMGCMVRNYANNDLLIDGGALGWWTSVNDTIASVNAGTGTTGSLGA